MTKINRHIEIMRSTAPGLSSLSQKSCAALYVTLKRHYTNVGVTTVNNLADLMALTAKQPDLVFIGMKFVRNGRGKIWVSEYLETRGIAHTGSPKTAIAFEQDKALAKRRVASRSLPTAKFMVVPRHAALSMENFPLQFPVFVKPVSLGGGSGVDEDSIARTPQALHAKLRRLSVQYAADALIEEYLPGREFSVAVLRDELSEDLLVMPIEMKPAANQYGDHILSLALKTGVLETPVSSVTDPLLRAKLTDVSKRAFMALGARDYGRIDIKLDAHGQPHFLEANLIPCIIEGSGNFPKACLMNADINYEAMILRIVRLGLRRNRQQSIQPISTSRKLLVA